MLGYLAVRKPGVILDLRVLDSIENVSETDLSVVVQAGCTWQSLHEWLTALGLRTPFWGTLPGRRATIGGTVSQNGAFWGSAAHGVSADSELGLEVVTGAGDVVRTGALANADSPADFRHYGPDLSGLLTGDCGAFGVKTRVALRLERIPPAARDLSFNFASFRELLAAIAAITQAGAATTAFGFDPFLANLRGRRESMAQDFRTLLGVIRGARSVAAGLRSAASMATAGRNFLDDAAFTLHIIVEAQSDAVADAAAAQVRQIAAQHAGREIEATIPKVMRVAPFPPLKGILGPNGERWMPVHCIVPHSRAVEAVEAILDVILAHEVDMARHEITTGTLFSTVGGGAVLIEPMFLWPDTLEPLHRETVEPRALACARIRPAASAAREIVAALRAAIIERTGGLGAAHLQIGRTYTYTKSLGAATRALVDQLRTTLDPRGIMNSGVLGL